MNDYYYISIAWFNLFRLPLHLLLMFFSRKIEREWILIATIVRKCLLGSCRYNSNYCLCAVVWWWMHWWRIRYTFTPTDHTFDENNYEYRISVGKNNRSRESWNEWNFKLITAPICVPTRTRYSLSLVVFARRLLLTSPSVVRYENTMAKYWKFREGSDVP